MFKFTLRWLRNMLEAAPGRLDPRFLGSAACNGCCPVANLARLCYPSGIIAVYVGYTKVDTQHIPHDAQMQAVIRMIDTQRKGTPISLGFLLDIIQAAEDLAPYPEEYPSETVSV